MSIQNNSMYSLWFLFSKKDTEYLKKIIQSLKEKFNFPEFIPHMAAFEEAKTNLDQVKMAATTSMEGIRSFKVKSKSISWSEDIWKTLFVNIEKNQPLETMYQKLHMKFREHSSYNFNPHISLMYKELSNKEKQNLATSISVKSEFLIEKIGIVDDTGKIEDWKVIEEIPLN